MPALGFPRPKIRTSLWGDLHALRIVSQWDSLSMPSTAPFGALSLGPQTLNPEYKFHRALFMEALVSFSVLSRYLIPGPHLPLCSSSDMKTQ